MKFNVAEQTIRHLLSFADVRVDGSRPWDIKVNNPEFYNRLLAESSMALGETYMDKWWECEAIDQLVNRLWCNRLDMKIKKSKDVILSIIRSRLLNLQSRSRAYIVAIRHYDLGNELYKFMLDKRMNYSCGYWKKAKTLDEAQEAKLDLICRKMKLIPGMKVLDIGCGWGSFAKYAAEKYDVKVVGITISKEQLKLAKIECSGMDVDLRLQDYRSLNEKFDRIVSIGMFEHVGNKNYKQYFKVANTCLKNDGLFLLHTIGSDESSTHINPWINKYIFPNAVLPSASQITRAAEGYMRLEDWHNFGLDYEKTLMSWYDNFNLHWEELKDHYDEKFKRMWNFYLLSCAGTFRARQTQLWQVVFSNLNSQVNYESTR